MSAHSSQSDCTLDSLFIPNVDLVIARKDEISIRFSVQVDIESTGEGGQKGCWVNISGPTDKVSIAKNHIRCLCAPEDIGTTQYPGDLHGYLSEKSMVFSLEQQYKVVVEFHDAEELDQPGEAVVKGSGVNVALALSAIEDMIATYLQQSDTSLGEASYMSRQHSYSDQTSSKLSNSLMGISSEIQLDRKDAAAYPDVLKKLILSWATDKDTDGEETIDIGDTSTTIIDDDDDEEEEETEDNTLVVSPSPKLPITSTPLVSPPGGSSSRVKVERLSYVPRPGDVRSYGDTPGTSGLYLSAGTARRNVGAGMEPKSLHRTARETPSVVILDDTPGPSGVSTPHADPSIRYKGSSKPGTRFFDLTSPAPFQADYDDDSSIVTLPPPQRAGESLGQTAKTAPKTTTHERRRQDSPTTQAERDMSTISLDETTYASSDELTSSHTNSRPGDAEQICRLAGIGATRGYSEVEVAQALSLCQPSFVNEQMFFSLLNKVRKDSTKSPSQDTKRRNTALESINKRAQSMSPGARSVMPNEKRVKTISEESPAGTPSVTIFTEPIRHPEDTSLRRQRELERRRMQSESDKRRNTDIETQKILVDIEKFEAAERMESQRKEEQKRQEEQKKQEEQNRAAEQKKQLELKRQAEQKRQEEDRHRRREAELEARNKELAEQLAAVKTLHQQQNQAMQPPLPQVPPPADPVFLPPLPAAPPLPNSNQNKTRMVVLDGSNIAFSHGKKYLGAREKIFSAQGILLAVEYLRKTYGATSENTKVIVPTFRQRDRQTREPHILNQLHDSGYLVYSPCKTMPGGKKIVPYDDRFILDLAVATDGVVISNDKYEDLISEQNHKYRDVINNRVIMFMFADDIFMIPTDPMGRSGPTLEQLLRPQSSQMAYASQRQQPARVNVHRPSLPYGANQNRIAGMNQSGSVAVTNRYRSLSQVPLEYPPASAVSSRLRSPQETQHITQQLLDMFPDRQADITQLMSRHPYESDVDVFVDYLI